MAIERQLPPEQPAPGESDRSAGSSSESNPRATSSVDIAQARAVLNNLHDEVVYGRSRIELTRENCERVCVMISKQELEALEVALEILSASPEYQSMCHLLARVAADADGFASASA